MKILLLTANVLYLSMWAVTVSIQSSYRTPCNSAVLTLQSTTSQFLPSSRSSFRQEATRAQSEDSAAPTGIAYVFALDRNGQPVTNLNAQELRLFENKVERKIISVSLATDEPKTIGLFFDISGTRRADKSIPEEVRLAGEFVHSIWHEGDLGFVVAFNGTVYATAQPTHTLEEIDEGLKGVLNATYFGPTALFDALCIAKPEKLNRVPGRRFYIAFSDFEDNTSKNRLEDVIALAHEAQVAIFPVVLSDGFGGGFSKRIEKRAKQIAREIADATGGEVLFPESPKQLPGAFAHLSNVLHATYRITYPAASASPSNNKKKLRIETTQPHLKLVYARD